MKILLIMPQFFDYPQEIIKELNIMGYEVDFYDDRPSTNAWVKAVIRINKNFIYSYIKSYFNKIMKTVKTKKYDIVFLISGQSLSFNENMIQSIKNCQPQAKFILYQWDSERNFPYIKNMHKFFDKCYSFDKNDTERNLYLKFLPLFYTRKYEDIGKRHKKGYKYDFCFVGTAHPQKYKYIKMMSQQLKEVYPNQFIYFYFPSKIVFLYRKLMNRELKRAHLNEFHYTPLKGEQMNTVYESAKCILDSAQAGQSGLTIRVFETLGAKKKLITTNKDIVNYDFYRPENIYVYDGEIDLNNIFFKCQYQEISEEIYKKYSITSWLKEILY